MIEQAEGGVVPLMELRLLCLAARLWPQAARGDRHASARRALARVFAAHAGHLEVSGRGHEVAVYADRALDLLVGHFTPERWWFDAVHAVGFTLAPNLKKGRNRRRVAYVRGWLTFTDDPYWQTSLYRDMAQYITEDGGHDQALQWLIEAETAAERLGHSGLVRLARHIQANTLLGLGRFEAAGNLLPHDAHPNVHQRSFEEMNWIETLLGLGERNAAHARLSSLYALVRKHGMSTEGPDALARRFDRFDADAA